MAREFAGYDDGFIRRYNARHKAGSPHGATFLVTWTGEDKIERLIGETAYSCKATEASLPGYRWEFCLEGADEYDPCLLQTWGSSLLEADPINWDAYEAVEPDPEEFAGYDDGFIRRYNARHKAGSPHGATFLVTWTGEDKIERLIGETAYSCKATEASLPGYRWEFCLEGADEYDPCLLQTWGSSLKEADPINWDDYEHVHPDPETQLLALWEEFKASRAAQETREEETPE